MANSHSLPFSVTLVQDYRLDKLGEDGQELRVHLPDSTEMEIIHRHEDLKESKRGESLIWVSGGGSYLINDEWLPLVQRSVSSPSNPGRLTIATGRADSKQEIMNPHMVVRELFEEIVLVLDSGEMILPKLKDFREFLPGWNLHQLENHLQSLLALQEHENHSFLSIESRMDRRILRDQIRVYQDDREIYNSRMCLHLDEARGEVNCLFLVHLTLEEGLLSRTSFIDTEFVVEREVRVPLRRKVYLYHLPTGTIYPTADGRMQLEDIAEGVELTPHAKFLIHRVENQFSPIQQEISHGEMYC